MQDRLVHQKGNERYDHLLYPILNLRMVDLIPAIYWLFGLHIQKRFKTKRYERKIARDFITIGNFRPINVVVTHLITLEDLFGSVGAI